MDAGADDVETRDGIAQVTCEPKDMTSVRTAFTDSGLEPSIAELVYYPKEFMDLPVEQYQQFEKLIDALNENEDVSQIHHNVNE